MALIATHAAAIDAPQRGNDDVARGGERDGGVQQRGRYVVALRAGGAVVEGALLLARRPRAHVDLASPGSGHLQGEEGRGPEPEQPQPASRSDACDLERPVADDAAAEQRRGGQHHRTPSGSRWAKSARTVMCVGISAVPVPARERRVRTQVLALRRQNRQTPQADASQPTPARSPTRHPATAEPDGLHAPDRLVAGDERQPVCREVSLHQLEVGATDGARRDRHERVRRPPATDPRAPSISSGDAGRPTPAAEDERSHVHHATNPSPGRDPGGRLVGRAGMGPVGRGIGALRRHVPIGTSWSQGFGPNGTRRAPVDCLQQTHQAMKRHEPT